MFFPLIWPWTVTSSAVNINDLTKSQRKVKQSGLKSMCLLVKMIKNLFNRSYKKSWYLQQMLLESYIKPNKHRIPFFKTKNSFLIRVGCWCWSLPQQLPWRQADWGPEYPEKRWTRTPCWSGLICDVHRVQVTLRLTSELQRQNELADTLNCKRVPLSHCHLTRMLSGPPELPTLPQTG